MALGDTVAIVQARMGSSRLPGKMMLPLAGEPVLRHVLRRLENAQRVDRIVLATSLREQDEVLENEAHRHGVSVHRGSESDVLGRILAAATEAGGETVVRICGDCPLLVPRITDATIERLEETGADYVSNKLDRTFPLGLDVEAFTLSSFQKVAAEAKDPGEREHVTARYLNRPEQFDRQNLSSDQVFSSQDLRDRTDLRLTLDVPADYEVFRSIFSTLGSQGEPEIEDVIRFLDREQMGRHHTTAEDLDD